MGSGPRSWSRARDDPRETLHRQFIGRRYKVRWVRPFAIRARERSYHDCCPVEEVDQRKNRCEAGLLVGPDVRANAVMAKPTSDRTYPDHGSRSAEASGAAQSYT